MAEQSDAVRRAEEALVAAHAALQDVEGELPVEHQNISVHNGVVNGSRVRIVSIISEKNARPA